MMKRKLLVSVLVAGGLIAPAAYATNGYFSNGWGIKSEGMGGVGIAFPQDSLAAATNPAGMVLIGNRADLGLELFAPNRSSQISGTPGGFADGNYSGNDRSLFPIPSFGYNRMMAPDYSLGVSIYGNGGMNTSYGNNPFAGYGGRGEGGVNLAQLFIAPTWSKKLNATNAIGVSLNIAYQKFSAQGIQGFAGATAPGIGTGSTSNNGTDSSTGYGLHIGWIGQVSPTITLGATYQTKTKMGKFNKYSGLFAEQGSFDIPAWYGAGVAFKAAPTTTVGFDVQRIMYGDVKSISNPLGGVPFNLGASNGAGFGWQNMTVYKLGVSYDWDSKTTLRAGWTHNKAPYDGSQTFFNILAPGIVKDSVSLGATWKLADKSEISAFYMHAFRNTVSGVNDIPAAYGGGNVSNTLSEDSVGVSYGW